MKIQGAHIIFANGKSPYKAHMAVEEGDIIESCVISGGEIYKDDDIDVLFLCCSIRDCEYSIKYIRKLIPPFTLITSCDIEDCKLPHCYYINCRIVKKDKNKKKPSEVTNKK